MEYPKGKSIHSIKSKYNNSILSVIPQPVNTLTYAVNVNDNCFYGYEDDYTTKQCAKTDNYIHPQYFEVKRILNNRDEESIMNKPISAEKTMVEYAPYTAFVHKTTQKCLAIDNEGLYMAPCDYMDIRQKWEVSPDETICLNK